jgi:hypothetical protein
VTIELLAGADGTADSEFVSGRTYTGLCWERTSTAKLADATITRVSDTSATISLTNVQTATFSALPFSPDVNMGGIGAATVLIDIIRTDTTPDQPADIMLVVPVWQQPS